MQPYTAPKRFDHVRQPRRITLAQINNSDKTREIKEHSLHHRHSFCTIPLHHWEAVVILPPCRL